VVSTVSSLEIDFAVKFRF